MQLRELAQTFARLEAARSRLVAVEIVRGRLARVTPTELEPVVYLLAGAAPAGK